MVKVFHCLGHLDEMKDRAYAHDSHANSIDKSEEGDYHLSARYTSTIYKDLGIMVASSSD